MQASHAQDGTTVLFYLSEVVGAPLLSPLGERLGALKDLIVQVSGEPFHKVKGLLATVGASPTPVYLPWDAVSSIDAKRVQLSTTPSDLRALERRDGEVLLAKEVLDKQIVDVAGRRVVRVNDAQLAELRGTLRLVGVDVSTAGFLARVLPRWLVEPRLQRQLISWSQVEYFSSGVEGLHLAIPPTKIAPLHPA